MPDHAAAAARMPSMQLVAQDYAEILDGLKAAQDTKGREKRATARMEVQAQVKVYPYKDGQVGMPFTCLTRDLSFRGVGLFQARQAARGSHFVVVLPRKQDREAASILCVVMYCRTMAEGLYNVGASFVKPFDLDAAPPVEVRPPGADAKEPAVGTGGQSPADAELDRIRQSILG
jgi:PilZ domain